MVLAIVLVVLFLVILFDFQPVLKRKNPKETGFYAAALLLGGAVLVLRSLDVNLPDPGMLIMDAVKALSLIP